MAAARMAESRIPAQNTAATTNPVELPIQSNTLRTMLIKTRVFPSFDAARASPRKRLPIRPTAHEAIRISSSQVHPMI